MTRLGLRSLRRGQRGLKVVEENLKGQPSSGDGKERTVDDGGASR